MRALVDTSVLVGAGGLDGDEIGERWAISVVTVGELEAGVLLAAEPSRRAMRLRRLSEVLAATQALPIDRSIAARYGELRAATGRRPTNDLWIAATALAHDLVLITRNERQAGLPLVRARILH